MFCILQTLSEQRLQFKTIKFVFIVQIEFFGLFDFLGRLFII